MAVCEHLPTSPTSTILVGAKSQSGLVSKGRTPDQATAAFATQNFFVVPIPRRMVKARPCFQVKEYMASLTISISVVEGHDMRPLSEYTQGQLLSLLLCHFQLSPYSLNHFQIQTLYTRDVQPSMHDRGFFLRFSARCAPTMRTMILLSLHVAAVDHPPQD
jgi:hypothetical protein